MQQVYLFGELLHDMFENGSAVPGGAPFNVAWNLAGFGLRPHLISAVGDDSRGTELLRKAEQQGIDISRVLRVPRKKTGAVDITVSAGEPEYTIAADCAYDYITCAPEALPAEGLLYYGSLAARSKQSRHTLRTLLEDKALRAFCDINIRNPWYSQALGEELIARADILKINLDEMNEITEHKYKAPLDGARFCMEQYNLSLLILTMGADGAYLMSRDEYFYDTPPKISGFRDAVGAGDAFASVVLAGIVAGLEYQEILRRALNFAGHVCTNTGAVTEDRQFYASTFSENEVS
ncbi:MAG: PfkB family carbohydrate kinase [Fibrobacterota bacterium]